MGFGLLRPYIFDPSGSNLSLDGSGIYQGQFLVDFDIASQFPLETVLAEAMGDFPSFVRGDPQDRVIPVHITISHGVATSQAQIDALKTAFDPFRDPIILQVRDSNDVIRQMTVKSLGLTPWEGHSSGGYVASLLAMEPIWEAATVTTISPLISGSAAAGHNFNLVNGGNTRTWPALTITPTTVKGNGNDFIRMYPLTIAWRSPLPGVDSQGLGYPIDIVNAAFDTAAEIAGGRMQADGDDIRVFVDGSEVDRYLRGINTTTTSIWCSISFQPAITAIVVAMASAVSPADGGSISITNPEGTSGFPEEGVILVDNEAIYYRSKSPTSFDNIRRGWNATTAAAHSVGATAYWVEHEVVMVTNYSAFAGPMASTDRKPILDLAVSRNNRHIYGTTDGFISPDTLRTGQWLRERRGIGVAAAVSRLSQAAGIVTVQDALPQAGSPNFDSVSLYTPCFVSTSVTGVALDYEVDHDMLLEVYGADAEGFEALLLRRDIRAENTGADYYVGAAAYANNVVLTPAALLSRISIQGRSYRITGNFDDTDQFSIDGSLNNLAQAFGLDGEERLDAYRVSLSEDGGGASILATICTLGPSGPSIALMGAQTLPPAAIPVTKTKVSIFPAKGVPGDIFRLNAGNYALVLARSGPVDVSAYGRLSFPFYPGGSVWNQSAGVWTESPPNDLAFIACGSEAEPQGDAALGLGTTVRWRNVRVDLSPSYIPAVVIGAAQAGYLMSGRLDNLTTGQFLTFALPLVNAVEIAVAEFRTHIFRSVWNTIGRSRAFGLTPDDISDWLRLNPGANSMRYTEANIGIGVIGLSFSWRDRWT